MDVNEQRSINNDAKPKTQTDIEQERAASEYNDKAVKRDGQLSMQVKVYSPFHDYYDGPTFSLSAENDTGPFDILPRHHNFISLLSPCELVLRTVKQGEQRIRISGGIMHVKADRVTVFLDV
jgi:ATP synthase delta/epsilon subunit-like protein